MAVLLALLFLVVPLAELAVIVQVASSIGVPNTIGLLVAVSVVGAWLAKREGLVTLRRIQMAIGRGEVPNREVADGALILLAAALMITPGFLSDVLALALLVPPSRAVVRGALMRSVAARGRVTVIGARRAGGRGARAERDGIWDVESWEEPPRASAHGELGEHR